MLHTSSFWPPLAEIVEIPDGHRGAEMYHLRWDRNEKTTICLRPVGNRTMIPLDAWGNSDSVWCPACARRAARPRPLIAQRREEAAIQVAES